MLGYWPYATHKKTNFDIYIYIFAAVASKNGYSKYEISIYFFLQHKKNSDFKINIPENKSPSLSFIFSKKKKRIRSVRVTCLSRGPGRTQNLNNYSSEL